MPFFILGYIAYLNISIGYKKKLICMQTKGCIQRKKNHKHLKLLR